MNLRPVWGISLTGLFACALASGCGKDGGYVMDYGKGGASAGQGGAPPNDGDAPDRGSGSDDDASDDDGAGSSDANSAPDASRDDANGERASDGAADAPDASADSMRARSDAASDASDAGDTSIPGDAARPDVSTEAPRDAAGDGRADVAADRPRSDATLPPPPSCIERCNDSTECMPALPIADYECDLATHRCVSCRNDEACVAVQSGWVIGCTTAASCGFAGDACITVNGVGKCAFTTASCGGAFPDTINATVFGTSNTVAVCGVATSQCVAGRCVDRCGPTNTCTPERGGRLCNGDTGRCECTDDIHCSGGVGVSKCNKATGECECAGNTDCMGVDDVDICVNGKCGCSKVAVCTRGFSGTTVTCE